MTPEARNGDGEEGDLPREFVKYSFYRLSPEWRRLAPEVREAGRRRLREVLEEPPPDLLLRTYSTVGTRGDVDFALWMIASDLEPIVRLHARIAGTPMGGYLEQRHSYLGMARRSEYLGEHAHASQPGEGRRPLDLPYLFVYPFIKRREWYSLPFEERRRIMGEHFRIGHRYPGVRIHTGYSFGLDDQEFILAFEGSAPSEFLDLVRDLRPTEASRYTLLEVPIFTCRKVPVEDMLALAEGIP
ncbi:MAG: chlorite dismutase family protein [Thermoplasmata archaeon]